MKAATMQNPAILALVNPPHGVLCEGLGGGADNRYSIVDPADGIRYLDGRIRSGATVKFKGSHYNTRVFAVIAT
jgi:hypothetical protein